MATFIRENLDESKERIPPVEAGNESDKACSVPISEKTCLTLQEAAAYTGVGINRLREISNEENCNFVLWIGTKRLLKRKLLDRFLESAYSI